MFRSAAKGCHVSGASVVLNCPLFCFLALSLSSRKAAKTTTTTTTTKPPVVLFCGD